MQEFVKHMIMVAVEEAGEVGISTNGLKRRTAGGRHFNHLVDQGGEQLAGEGRVEVVKIPPKGGGAGRPMKIIRQKKGAA